MCALSTNQSIEDAARQTILTHLWGAAAREPLPAIAHRHTSGSHLTITLTDNTTITGPAAAAEPFTQPHHLQLTTTGGNTITQPAALAKLISGHSPHADTFIAHINESVHGLSNARAAATPHPHHTQLLNVARQHHPDPSVYFEQLVTDGHPIHPLCRTRSGLTTTQQRRYAPEHQPHVSTPLIAIPHDHAHLNGTWPWKNNLGQALLPLHPLQADKHQHHSAHHLDTAPLMSLRTLAPYHYPHHIKTALDIQMTSAIRQVSSAASHNSPHLTTLLTTLTAATPLIIQPETGSLAIDEGGQPSATHAAIVRTNTAALLPSHHTAIPLAALATKDPASGQPLIAKIIAASPYTPRQWWQHTVELLLTTTLKLLSTYGIALEAHGQNTLLVVDNHAIPRHTMYRDFGGIRINPHTLRNSHTPPPLYGDVPTNDTQNLHTKLIAALYTVAISQLVDALARSYQQPHETWWQPVAATTHTLTKHDKQLHHALFAQAWPIKATTAMRLATNPTNDIWAQVPNPLANHT